MKVRRRRLGQRNLWCCVVLALVSACGPGRSSRTTLNPQIPVSGPETWTVGVREWSIEGTDLILSPDGSAMLAVKALFQEKAGPSQEPLARELATYALHHGYLEKAASALPEDGRFSVAANIGVALINRVSTPVGSVAGGYRYNFQAKDLQEASTATEIDTEKRPNQ